MDSNQDDFETLRKLMALKRHEQPSPEYLHRLSGTIMTRIERGEGRRNMWDRVSANFAVRPMLAYAFGLTVCGALGLSAVYMIRQEMTQADSPAIAMLKGPALATAYVSDDKPAAPSIHVKGWLANTNPTADSAPQLSLFNTPRTAVPVSYEPGK